MKRAVERVDRSLRLVDELLSSGKLQRSARLKLLELRRELQELRDGARRRKPDLVNVTLRWATIIARLHDILDRFFE